MSKRTASVNREVSLKALFEDDFERHLEGSLQDPRYRAAFEDAGAASALLATLVQVRKDRNLNQTVVASRMGVKQPFVSQFENSTGDPHLSTLQRYARAVECQLVVRVTSPTLCDWVSPASVAYAKKKSPAPAKTPVRAAGLSVDGWGHKSDWVPAA